MAQQGMDQAAAGGGDVSADEIVQNVGDTIMSLAQAAGQQRPDVAQKLQKIGQEFMDVMSEFVGGGAQQQRGGVRPVQEQGQGMPAGPQGAM